MRNYVRRLEDVLRGFTGECVIQLELPASEQTIPVGCVPSCMSKFNENTAEIHPSSLHVCTVYRYYDCLPPAIYIRIDAGVATVIEHFMLGYQNSQETIKVKTT